MELNNRLKLATGLLVLWLLLSAKLSAQTFNEWFRQKRTQERYLVEQIAALKVYAGTAWKGYQVARSGLNTISRIREGKFNLFEEWLAAMDGISPEVRDNHLVEGIIVLQGKILAETARGREMLKWTGLRPREQLALEGSYREGVRRSLAVLAEMYAVLKPFRMEMENAQRLEVLEDLYVRMENIHVQLRARNRRLNNYRSYRKWQQVDGQIVQELYEDEN
ncbi:hypothetical protein [Echinicola rosea]|uniref:Uncharacterized protein n=1 Tax=Echinicola rosea TaxID=1807691 RepID=A0ABQ1V8K0_9BACT|nr:hypothetical protein [Echinicola rosea]GGF44152.1 hypothetical protein GCM10011339_35790 [Echinicola rosea]